MCKKISNWLIKVSAWWVALIFLAIFIIFTATEVVSQKEKSAEYQGEAGSIDLSFFYSADDIFNMAEVYGEEGREEYILARSTFDAIFPLIFGAFLVTSISFLTGKQFEQDSKWLILNIFPVIGVIFDYLENSFAILIMEAYPDKLNLLASITPFMTMFKWVFVGGSFIVLFALIIRLFIKKLLKR